MKAELKVTLIEKPGNADGLAGLAASICTANGNACKSLEHALDSNHLSVTEHANFTFYVDGVSRALLAQLTRHRIASFSVQSQRYVSYESGFGYIVPPAIRALGEEAVAEYEGQMAQMQQWYEGWQQKLGNAGEKSNEDARFVLPGACETRVLFTMNARELRHFFALRMCNRAQWEIRAMAQQMFEQVYPVAPALFADAGPGCISGPCPEGGRSCGKLQQMRAERQAFLAKMNGDKPAQ